MHMVRRCTMEYKVTLDTVSRVAGRQVGVWNGFEECTRNSQLDYI